MAMFSDFGGLPLRFGLADGGGDSPSERGLISLSSLEGLRTLGVPGDFFHGVELPLRRMDNRLLGLGTGVLLADNGNCPCPTP